jgi:hypothetical protein
MSGRHTSTGYEAGGENILQSRKIAAKQRDRQTAGLLLNLRSLIAHLSTP